MTCEYTDIDTHDALYNLARRYPGGVDAIAHRLGISSAVLRSKLRKQVSTHHTNLDEFSDILEKCEEAKVDGWQLPLRALCWRHGHVAIEMPSGASRSDDALMSLVCKAFKENGDVADRISRALSDDRITKDELTELDKEIEEAIAALLAVGAFVKAKAESA